MDSLSQLVDLLDPSARMDVKCVLGAPWALDNPPAAAWTAPFHYLLHGEASLRLDDSAEPMALRAGSLLILPHGAAHRLEAGPAGATAPNARRGPGPVVDVQTNRAAGAPADVEILCGHFQFRSRRRSALLDALPAHIVIVPGAESGVQRLESLVRMVSEELDAAEPGAAAIVSSLSAVLFALALRAYVQQQQGLSGLLGLLAHPRLAAGLNAMLTRPAEPWTAEQLAALCHVSRATFMREFKAVTGRGPLEVLTSLRMEMAAGHLARGQHPTAAVGEMVGYQSEAAFNRAFARHAGMTPGRFRRQPSA